MKPTLTHQPINMKQNPDELEKRILRGDLKDHYVIYVRKSTDDEDIQKNSLKFQKQEDTRYAQRERLPIATVTLPGFATSGIISEKHSAFKVGEEFEITKSGRMILKIERPKFHRLLFYLQRGCFKGVIFYCWDRACRNDIDKVAIKRLIQAAVDIRFVTTTYENNSSGEVRMDIEGMFAQHQSRVTSDKVTAVTRDLRAQGICTYRAPVGYLNPGRSDHKPFDPERAEQIKKLFEKMASGDWTLSALERWSKDTGLTMPPMRRRRTVEEMLADEEDETEERPKISQPMTVSNIHKALTNRFYTGYVKGPSPGEWVKSVSHKALVPLQLFERVQARLQGRRVSAHYQSVLELPYRKFVRCGACQRIYTPYTQKGHVYLGSRRKRTCDNPRRNFSVAELENEISGILAGLSFTEPELATFEARLQQDISSNDAKRKGMADEAERRKKRLRADLSYLRDNKLPLLKSGVYTFETYAEDEVRLTRELQLLQNEPTVSAADSSETMQQVVKVSELLKTVAQHYEIANSTEREQFARIIFSELQLSEKGLSFSLTPGMRPFEKRLSAVCCPTTWISEISACRADLSETRRLLAELILPSKT